jgi:hypothetical protein
MHVADGHTLKVYRDHGGYNSLQRRLECLRRT